MQSVPVRGVLAVVRRISEKLLHLNVDLLVHRFQAARAFPGYRRMRGGGDQHTLGHRLHPHGQLHVSALGHASQPGLHIGGGRDGTGLRMLRARAAAQVKDAEDQRLARIEARWGVLS